MDTPSKPDATQEETAAKVMATKPTRRWRAWVFQVYVVTAAIGFAILFLVAGAFTYSPIDLSIARRVQTINAAWFYDVMWVVSVVGYPPQVAVLTGAILVVLFVIGLRWEAVMAALAALGVSGAGALVKIIVHRPRPSANLIHVAQQLDSYSFPSGHVLLYTAFLGFLLFLAYTLLKRSLGRTLILSILGGLVGLVGLSRIYLGDHWASDVLGAYLLGSLWLAVTIHLYRWGQPRYFVRQPLAPDKSKSPATQSWTHKR